MDQVYEAEASTNSNNIPILLIVPLIVITPLPEDATALSNILPDMTGLDDLAIEYLKSQANFFLIRVAKSADEVFEDLLKQGVIVRSMTPYGYPDCIRVNVGRHHENVRLLEALEVVLKKSKPSALEV